MKKEDFLRLTDFETVKIDYSPTELSVDDKVIVFVSETLKILGIYQKKDDYLLSKRLTKKEITLREFYDKLSIITEIGPRTYKVFAKKLKEIEKSDYENIIKYI
jgi:hypothetical protein